MATHIPPGDLDLQEQLVRIRARMEESEKFSAETRKIVAETRVVSYAAVFQGLIAVGALLGVGAAIAKLFFP